MPVVHLTARLRDPLSCFLDEAHGRWLWAALRRSFPDALSATFMPNHPHLVTVVEDVERCYESFVKVLAAFARRLPFARPIWEPTPRPDILKDPVKILRSIRYVALNPARGGFVDDPLKWYWSTHRDVLGATHDPWVTLERVRAHVPPRYRDVARLHDYASADRSTHVDGTPMPRAANDDMIRRRSLDDLLVAAASVTRGVVDELHRRGPMRDVFVWLAKIRGWTNVRGLAEFCGISRKTVWCILQGPAPSALAAARLVLGDSRLLHAAGAPKAVSAVRGDDDVTLGLQQERVGGRR